MAFAVTPPVTTFAVTYTATGSEGTDFTIPIGATLASGSYAVIVQSAGGASVDGTQSSGVEVIDLPITNRTTTTFRIVLGQALAPGDVLQFLVTGSVVG